MSRNVPAGNAARPPASKMPLRMAKLIRLRFGLPYARRGDAARLRNEWLEAVYQYRRAIDWLPWREDLKIQIGNCLRAFGDIEGALSAYHSVGSVADRAAALAEAAEAHKLEGFRRHAFHVTAEAGELPVPIDVQPLTVQASALPRRVKRYSGDARAMLGTLGNTSGVPRRLAGGAIAAVKLDQVGAMTMERDGVPEPLLCGVVALRGRVLSVMPVDHVELWSGSGVGEQLLMRVATRPAQLNRALKLQVFNLWFDSARLPPGRHWLSIKAGTRIEPAGLYVNVGVFKDDEKLAQSNAYVPSSTRPDEDCDTYVRGLPALIRPARRSLFSRPVQSILAVRADQLGDVSASLPAFARLRALFPEASITALVQPGLRDIVEASGVADRVLTVALDYDPSTERRCLREAEQARLAEMLSGGRFDLAIDLSPGDETRPLLLLCTAEVLVGFNPDRFTYLDFGISVRSRDKVNLLEKVSHAKTVSMLIEAMAIAAQPAMQNVPSVELGAAILSGYGLEHGKYVVLHTGSRHPINRWPLQQYVELARRLLEKTILQVVMFFDDADSKSKVASQIVQDGLHLCDKMPPASFDAILSSAGLVIANDSGPKHLAAVRGVPTVSLHVGRLNWNEWGQDGSGVIVSKRVPCAGCALNDVVLCGKEALCLTSITVEEVLTASEEALGLPVGTLR